ncbi:MAG: EpsG family protein [Prevotella sp.]|jgi:hypothetical protein|nr:EpsG family protein [Prevotella sp.]
MIYFVVILLLLFLSFRYDINEKTYGRNHWYMAVLILFILISGLRYRVGIDTVGYIRSYYYSTPTVFSFFSAGYTIGDKPLWKLLNSICYTFGARFYIVQLITAAFCNVLVFKYIKKHSDYIFTCLFFYFIYLYPAYNFETMKAFYAIVLSLYGNDCFLEKKWIKGYSFYIIAALFHTSTIALFIVPLLLFLRMNRIGLFILLLAFVAGYILQKNLGDYFVLLDFIDDESISDKLEDYAESDRYGTGRGLLYIVGKLLPLLLFSFISFKKVQKNNGSSRLLELEPFLMMGMLFVVLMSNIYIFYRFTQFFGIYFVIFFAQLFVDLCKSRKFSKGVSYARAFLLFSPLLFAILIRYRVSYVKYVPYSSVIEKNISKEREKLFDNRENGTVRLDQY